MTILLFGITKDIIRESTLNLTDFTSKNLKTVLDLKVYLKNEYPELEKLSSLAIAVNSVYAEDTLELKKTDEVALIPPVSGG